MTYALEKMADIARQIRELDPVRMRIEEIEAEMQRTGLKVSYSILLPLKRYLALKDDDKISLSWRKYDDEWRLMATPYANHDSALLVDCEKEVQVSALEKIEHLHVALIEQGEAVLKLLKNKTKPYISRIG